MVFKENGQSKSRILTLLSFREGLACFKELKSGLSAKNLLSIKKMGPGFPDFPDSEVLIKNLLKFKKAKQPYSIHKTALAY